MSEVPAPAECLCAIRGYCADVPGDPLACPVCVRLDDDEECPAAVTPLNR
jgi:hypothetical protein